MSVNDHKVGNKDSFEAWRNKYNALIDEPVINLFPIETDTGSLDITVSGGNVRKAREHLVVADATLTLSATTADQYVVLQADTDFTAATIEVYEFANLPSENDFNIVPLYNIETDDNGVISVEDLRAVFNFGGGGKTESILKFDKNITEDTTITSEFNALSVDPTVANGVTVTVDQDSVWVIL